MDERIMQFRVGVMVLATLIITGILVAMFGEMPKIIYGEYKLEITFDQAPGVTDGTPVRKSGILIGRVTKVRFSDEDTKVVVTVAIKDKFHLRRNERCQVRSNLLGDASLDFIRSTDINAPADLLKNGDNLEGRYLPDPNQLVLDIQNRFDQTIKTVQGTSESLSIASNKLTGTLGKLDEVLGDENTGVKKAIDQANDILSSTKNIIGEKEEQEKLRESIRQMPEMIKDMRKTVDVVNQNMINVEKFTRPLGERGEALFENLDNLVTKLSEFSDTLNRSQGTIGQLINNPELYQHMNRAAKNIEELSRQLKPIVEDARVFSDKIARHPEVLGVRGAVQKSVGIK